MLEMGEPIPIIELARRMIQLSGARVGVDIEIEVTGIRPGEKLCEDLRESDEEVRETEHPSISRLLPVTTQKTWFDSCLEQLAEATQRGDAEGVRRLLFVMAGSALDFVPSAPATPGLGPEGVHGVNFANSHYRHGSAESKTERTGA